MADVLNRTTKVHQQSVNTPDFPTAAWIINPDLSAVVGFESKYWTITGDVVTLMSVSERAAVDTAEAAALTTSNRSGAVASVDQISGLGVEHRALIQLLNKRDNFNTNRIVELQNRVQAMLDSTGGVANLRIDGLAVSISATSTRPLSDARQDYKDDINAGLVDA